MPACRRVSSTRAGRSACANKTKKTLCHDQSPSFISLDQLGWLLPPRPRALGDTSTVCRSRPRTSARVIVLQPCQAPRICVSTCTALCWRLWWHGSRGVWQGTRIGGLVRTSFSCSSMSTRWVWAGGSHPAVLAAACAPSGRATQACGGGIAHVRCICQNGRATVARRQF